MHMGNAITIIIPTYNRISIILHTLDSIKKQKFKNWECIVVDDNSTDNTIDVLTEYVLQDPRFTIIRNNRKKGAQGARNTGLYYSNSEWILFFDSDNIMHPDFLKELMANINDHIDVCNCYSRLVHVEDGPTGQVFDWNNYGNIHKQLFTQKTYVDFNHAIIRRSKLIEIGGLDEDCPSMQEWDTHIRLSKIANYYTVQKPLIDYYVGGKDAISSDTKREVLGRMYILRKHHAEWRLFPRACHSFVYQTQSLIDKNPDGHFKQKAYLALLPFKFEGEMMLTLMKIKNKTCTIFKKLSSKR